ncbi:hypothetical protein LJR230_004687 [Trinickia sp. LjRoot230]|uniref:hypothetical protein n=1 Tax=Trinickia sp. LjRoot230 TaxID=3342288 RepID=UPI003ED0AFBF
MSGGDIGNVGNFSTNGNGIGSGAGDIPDPQTEISPRASTQPKASGPLECFTFVCGQRPSDVVIATRFSATDVNVADDASSKKIARAIANADTEQLMKLIGSPGVAGDTIWSIPKQKLPELLAMAADRVAAMDVHESDEQSALWHAVFRAANTLSPVEFFTVMPALANATHNSKGSSRVDQYRKLCERAGLKSKAANADLKKCADAYVEMARMGRKPDTEEQTEIDSAWIHALTALPVEHWAVPIHAQLRAQEHEPDRVVETIENTLANLYKVHAECKRRSSRPPSTDPLFAVLALHLISGASVDDPVRTSTRITNTLRRLMVTADSECVRFVEGQIRLYLTFANLPLAQPDGMRQTSPAPPSERDTSELAKSFRAHFNHVSLLFPPEVQLDEKSRKIDMLLSMRSENKVTLKAWMPLLAVVGEVMVATPSLRTPERIRELNRACEGLGKSSTAELFNSWFGTRD